MNQELILRQSLVKAASEKYQQSLLKKALGERTEKLDLALKQRAVFENSVIDIKKELRQSIKHNYSSQIGELVTRIEILADLFSEMEHTLNDVDQEPSVGKSNIFNFKYISLKKFEKS